MTGGPARPQPEAGATLVEFALVFPFFLLIMGFLFYGALYLTYGALAQHAALAAERAVTIPCGPPVTRCPTPAQAADKAGLFLPSPAVHPQPSAPSAGDVVTVTLTYSSLPGLSAVRSFLPFLPGSTTIVRTVQGRME